MGETFAIFFHAAVTGSFSRMDDRVMHDEWRQGSGSTSSAEGS